MRSNRLWTLLLLFGVLLGCGGGGGGGGGDTPQLLSITVTPANPSLAVGSSQPFTATGTYSDNSTLNLTDSVTWSSSNPTFATINNSGLATGVAAGSATISATSGGITGSTALTVHSPTNLTLTGITITPGNSTVGPGTPLQYTATGTFSDQSTQDLTNAVSWSSSNPAVGSISNVTGSNGRLTAKGPLLGSGTTTISATLGGLTSGTQLSVSAAAVQNVMQVTVNGSLCSPDTSASYPNKPCVSVTVCEPGSANCVVVTDVLLDTMSYGLRVFKSALGTLNLPQVASGSGQLAECVQFADLSSIWGPVRIAGVKLGAEPTVQVPIQVIDASFSAGNIPATTACVNADTLPANAGYHGILGVGPFPEDCGAGCSGGSHAANGLYFSCTASGCVGTGVNTSEQVQNPVARLPQDNNGVIVELPSVPLGGVTSVDGVMVLGINTQSNNVPLSVVKLAADQNGDFVTAFKNSFYKGFFDTGSNGIFFSDPAHSGLATCSADSSWYCPPGTVTLTATNTGATGVPSDTVVFRIGNFSNLTASGNRVFSELGGPAPGTFDWGLPFFLGRNVYVGIANTTSSLGTGPYWAY